MIVAIIPIKRNSSRVPGKNFVEVNGRALYRHVIDMLIGVEAISTIVVDTDCPELLADLRALEKVELRTREPALHGDEVVMNQLLEPVLGSMDAEHFLQTHVTNPLLTADTVRACIERYFEGLDRFDCLFTVTEVRKRAYHADARPINHDLSEMKMTQDLPPVYIENSNLFLFSRKSYFGNGNNRIGKAPQMYPMDELEGLDIDTPVELEMARLLLARRFENGG